MRTTSLRVQDMLLLVLAIAGNALLAWIFWSAWQSHEWYNVFLHGAGPRILIAEFLAIYAGGITSGKQVEAEKSFGGRELVAPPQKRRAVLLITLVLAALCAGWLLHNVGLALFFIVSLLVKYVGHRVVRSRPLTVISLVWFLASLAVLAVPESFFRVDTFLLWGVACFGVFAVIITALCVTSRRL